MCIKLRFGRIFEGLSSNCYLVLSAAQIIISYLKEEHTTKTNSPPAKRQESCVPRPAWQTAWSRDGLQNARVEKGTEECSLVFTGCCHLPPTASSLIVWHCVIAAIIYKEQFAAMWSQVQLLIFPGEPNHVFLNHTSLNISCCPQILSAILPMGLL